VTPYYIQLLWAILQGYVALLYLITRILHPALYSDEISGRIARYKATLYMSQFLYSFSITFI